MTMSLRLAVHQPGVRNSVEEMEVATGILGLPAARLNPGGMKVNEPSARVARLPGSTEAIPSLLSSFKDGTAAGGKPPEPSAETALAPEITAARSDSTASRKREFALAKSEGEAAAIESRFGFSAARKGDESRDPVYSVADHER